MYTATITWGHGVCPKGLFVGEVFESLDKIKEECIRHVKRCLGSTDLNFDWYSVVSLGETYETATFEASNGQTCWVEIIKVRVVQ